MRRPMPLAELLERAQERAVTGDRVSRLRAQVVESVHADWESPAAGRRLRFGAVGLGGGRWLNLLGSGAVGACLALVAIAVWPARPLTFHVAGRGEGSTPVGAWIEAGRDPEVPVWFSDGTVLALQKGARMKVDEIAARGANVVVSEGSVRVAVTHRPKARWLLRVGPFDVRVTGTRFDVGWVRETGEFTLSMEEGSVVVSGACLPQDRPLSKGETLRARCGPGAEPRELPATAPAASLAMPALAASAVAPPAPPPSGPQATEAAARVGPAAAPPPAGLPATPEPAADPPSLAAQRLLESADAARLAGDGAKARAALLALRRQFPTSAQAAVAAFDLGVMAHDAEHDPRGAAGWFERYLREAPAGTLRREAMGRLIEASRQAGDQERARGASEKYLHDYPGGPHADLARDTLR